MSTYRSEQLAAEHDLQAFDSGAEALDTWLRGAARHADAARTGRTFERTVDASTRVAARLVVVDALDARAAGFYLRYGFRRCPHPQRLVRKTSDIAAALRHS